MTERDALNWRYLLPVSLAYMIVTALMVVFWK